MYNVNGIRVKTGCFCQRTKLLSVVEAILPQASAANCPASTAIWALMKPLHSQRVRV